MLFANTSFRRDTCLITSWFTSSNAPDFPKCGCKGTTFLDKNQIFRKKVVILHPQNKKISMQDIRNIAIKKHCYYSACRPW